MTKACLRLIMVAVAAFCGIPALANASSRTGAIDPSPPSVAPRPAMGPIDSPDGNPAPPPDGNGPPAPPSPPALHFDRLSAEDGLSFSLSTSILQDQLGFMWFGTRFGLNKYDGFNFTVYTLQSRGDVLSANFVRRLCQDRTGDLWIVTDSDLVRRDHETGELVHYQYDGAHLSGLGMGKVLTVGEDSAGTIWVGLSFGLDRYNRSTDTFTHFLTGQFIRCFYTDRRGGVWLGTDLGLRYYASGHPELQQTIVYRHILSDPASLSSDVVNAVYEDGQGVVWVGTSMGLNRLDRATGAVVRYQHDVNDARSLSDNWVNCILEDDVGRLWVGTNNGLNLLERTTDRFARYYFDPANAYSLSNDVVVDLYQDRSGVVWVATLSGICKVNETASQFTHYRQGPNAPVPISGANALSDNIVGEVYQDSQGIVWIGTVTGGLNRLDPKTGSVTVYRHDPASNTSLGADEVTAIYEDRAGRLWIGSSNGLDLFNPVWETFASQPAFRGYGVMSIVEDHEGNLLIGYYRGILRRQPGALSFTPVPLLGSALTLARIQTIYPDQGGSIWVATADMGLFRLDAGTGSVPEVIRFPQAANDPNSPGLGSLSSFYEDPNGALWIGSIQDGLIRFDRDSQKFVHYSLPTGMGTYTSYIQGDAQGRLWMGTMRGLARFDPRRETWALFDARDGLEIGEVLAGFQGKQGEMFFGGMQGLNAFFPDQIRSNIHAPAVVITSMNLRNQVLRTDLPPNDQIELSYQDNYLSFDFVALDFAAPSKNQYAYKMEGLESGWIEAGTRRHADYPALKPGRYTFRVKASNNSGVWNEQGASVQITIAPPFWQMAWFRSLLVIGLVAAAVVGVRLRLGDVEARSRDLQRQVSERTGALELKTRELQQRTRETETRRQELEALLVADDRMQRHLQQDQVLQALVDVAVDNLRADKSAVFWLDQAQESLPVRVARGWGQKALSELESARGESLVGEVAAHGEPALVKDSLTDARVGKDPSLARAILDEGVRSLMFLPITLGKQVLGVFNVGYAMPHAVGPDEQRVFQALTQRAALYVENARLYEGSQELAVVRERSRLARELHDAVTQTLFSASLVAEALPATWERDPEEGKGLLKELRGLSRGALAEMRTLLLELRPAALVETRLQDLLRQLGEAASGRSGIPISVQVEEQAELPADVRIAFYRITQEALNNVVKHSRAHQVTVRLGHARLGQAAASAGAEGKEPLESASAVLLTIGDDGRGFDAGQVSHSRLGMGIMQERAQAIGASLTVESKPGHGTQVTVLWESEQKQEAE